MKVLRFRSTIMANWGLLDAWFHLGALFPLIKWLGQTWKSDIMKVNPEDSISGKQPGGGWKYEDQTNIDLIVSGEWSPWLISDLSYRCVLRSNSHPMKLYYYVHRPIKQFSDETYFAINHDSSPAFQVIASTPNSAGDRQQRCLQD